MAPGPLGAGGGAVDCVLVVGGTDHLDTRVASLLRDTGYEVHSVRGAVEASPPWSGEDHIDIVLIDSRLPGADVMNLASRWAREVPVVILGTNGDVDLESHDVEAGAIDFVPQPVEARELVARVKRHLTVARMRRALSDSEARFRSVTESAIDAIISADAQGAVRAWNRAAEAIFGWSASDAIGQPLEIIIPERFHAQHQAGIARISRGEPGRIIGQTVELFARHRSGRELPVELSLATWTLGDDRFFTGILRDITDRREAETRIRAVTDSAVDAILSIDTLGQLVAWNPAAERLFGYTEKEMIGQPVDMIIPERFREAHRAGMNRMTQTGSGRVVGRTVELAAIRRSGEEFPIELSLSTWLVDGQRHYTGIIRDITERHQAERRLKVYAEEITDKHNELQAQHAELVASQEALARSLSQVQRLFAVVAEALDGQTIGGRYRLDGRLARGGFGVVYRGVDTTADRPVAVKVLSPPRSGERRAHLERFRREGVAALRVDHPNAVELLDQGVTDAGLPYLVMELLSGETLRERLARERTLPLGDALEIAAAVAACLAAAHAKGVIHRDITPANIYLHRAEAGAPTFVTKVLDFGLAKLDAALGDLAVTRQSELIGTPHYVAPERVTGGEVGPPNDIYSLGVVIFEAVVGEMPFPPTPDTWEVMYSRVARPPRLLRSLDSRIPEALEVLVNRCLERDPGCRPASAGIRQELRRLAATLPIPDLVYRRSLAEETVEESDRTTAARGDTGLTR